MNTAVLQGSILATSHGISRLNRHRQPRQFRISPDQRLANVIQEGSSRHHVSRQLDQTPLLGLARADGEKDAPDDAQPSTAADEYVRLNVGGQRFVLRSETILKRKVGRLQKLARGQQDPEASFSRNEEYFYERAPALFHVVYQFYLSGLIHQPGHLCPQDILDELRFWQIPIEPFLAPCCCYEQPDEQNGDDSSANVEKPNLFKNLCCGKLRRAVWDILEEPTSSTYSNIFAILSVFFVCVSIVGLVLGSIPELQAPVKSSKTLKNGSTEEHIEMEPLPIFGYVEYVCIVWFAMEYSLKMLVTPHRKRTFFELLNIIDLLSIVPFLIEMMLLLAGISTDQLRDLKGAFLVIRILRVLRVIRVLKLGRYSSGLQMFGKTLKASFRQLGMMAMVVATGVIFFSTLVYFLEKDEPNSQFYSIPAASWWCIVTMTTVGYGDLTPVTVPGKLVATGAIACGVLVLALPITIIVDNFMKVAEGERSSLSRRFGGGERPFGPTAGSLSPKMPLVGLQQNNNNNLERREDTAC